jgi:ABC-type phosphate transport system substrate-binding protein
MQAMKVLSARRLRLIPVCIISVAAAIAAAVPGTASALGKVGQQCSGVAITGQGAAVEKVAQDVWTNAFHTSSQSLACDGAQGSKGAPVVTYNSTSSGAGLRSWGAETKKPEELSFGPANAFVASAEAPNPKQQGEILKEESTETAGTLETLPVAQFALTVYVNLPTGCTATSTAAPGRLVLTYAALQGIYAGTITTWGGITGGGDALSPASPCDSDPITAVVRKEKAGTTNALKKFLGLINTGTLTTPSGSETWDQLSEGSLNAVWPTALVQVKTTVEGDANEAETVAANPGSIGYSNLAELRVTNLFSGTGNGAGTAKFWVEVENSHKGSGKKEKVTFQDPATNKDVEAAGSANCSKTVFTNGSEPFPPPSVTETWNLVTTSITLKEKTYPICNFAYTLAFTKYSLLAGTSEAEATTVNNYVKFASSSKQGQKLLASNDYFAVPKDVIKKLEAGAAAIGF